MKLLEYEAKRLLKAYGLPVPDSQLIKSAMTATQIDFPVVLKVQIPKGGRGKAGGIRIANDQVEYKRLAGELLAKPILDCQVSSLLIEEKLVAERELYLAIAVDRASGLVTLLAHKRGGVEIEQAANDAEPLVKIGLHKVPGEEEASRLQRYYDLPGSSQPKVQELIEQLYEVCVQEDALLVEVNPLVVSTDGRLVCADAKVELDDAASFRHPEWAFEAAITSNQFVELNVEGTVASMANGAGLAMATVDAIKSAGAEPANFYDVGGGTDVQGMVKAFQKLAGMPKVQAIVVNIFGGITRCDEVAQAIVQARQESDDLPRLFIRLTGTNEAEGRDILKAAGIEMYPTLADCVQGALKEVR